MLSTGLVLPHHCLLGLLPLLGASPASLRREPKKFLPRREPHRGTLALH